jgi:hypothetical protein
VVLVLAVHLGSAKRENIFPSELGWLQGDVVNLVEIIQYATNTRTLDSIYTTGDNCGTTVGNGTLLAHMAGRSASGTTTCPGDICKVLAAKQGASTSKCKMVKVNETSTAPRTTFT